MFVTAIDTITPSQPITDLQSITSSNKTFRLGFFSPENTTNRYVGIWYNNIPGRTVVWVANRNRPLVDSSGTITVSEDGNLLVLNGQKEIVWSSNVSNSGANSSAQLLDSGNLVLEDNSGRTIWESFRNPTDSFLPRMKLSVDASTGERISLKSWKTPSDPSLGSFYAEIKFLAISEVYVLSGNRPRWRSGPWSGQVFIGIPQMNNEYLDGFRVVEEEEGSGYITFTKADQSLLTYFVLNHNGILTQKDWIEDREEWAVSWSSAETECDVYGKCGQFGSCNSKDSPVCSCLRGFEPKHVEEWNGGNFTGGCVRRTPLQCERNGSSGQENKKDGFFEANDNESAGVGRVVDKSRNLNAVIAISVIVGSIMIAVCMYFSWMWMVKHRGMKKKNWFNIERLSLSPKNSPEITCELPLFNFASLEIATNNFHVANRLGQGGFGPVYKGILADGQEIAVKRLSRSSGQGLEQFMNEVVVISKLQHRNLVRLLGCCVEGEEKLLVYEYLPNKSLDAFLFDPHKQELLDWRKRLNIIEGIGRGLLYLHRDSRLRIIHRDLKASNILLDQELNPKISDFGMARIFAGNEDQANTRRVVGTYGYMAPEYAMEGRFSEKSDVFSFGVLLLEIVSGRRNTSFYSDERSLSLLGHAWKSWNEGNILTLIDPRISCEDFQTEILRWIHVGLLCVQEFATDRPTVYTVLSMLTSETANLAKPKQPAFTQRPDSSEAQSSQGSNNIFSITVVEGR
ncbi:S-locus lectin protein kinase family protein [Actinidia rufa]|uniref:Receptor-like serine/threonine-protein kinase n=1 Tax=Actinidia rufa TaxID=165716 RepID=A0A7J0EZY7_9ERIC|nr:S-locus lectin protein kinase family protein [Actinidia rufa]